MGIQSHAGDHVKTVIYYYHIPKCGGSFLREQLKAYAERFDGHFQDFTDLKSDEHFAKNQEILLSFLEGVGQRRESHIFIHHHHRFGGLFELGPTIADIGRDIISQGHRILFFTVVRNPESLHVSRLNYLANTGEYTGKTMEQYLDNTLNHNFLSRYLMFNHPSMWGDERAALELDKEAVANGIQLFDRIFVQEHMAEALSYLQRYLGLADAPDSDPVNVGSYGITPSPEDIARIRQISEIDNYIYQLVLDQTWKQASGPA